jgi:endonuclease IV
MSILDPEELVGGGNSHTLKKNIGIHWDRSHVTIDKLHSDFNKYGLTLKYIQLFTHGPRNKNNIMKPDIVQLLQEKRDEYGLKIYVHMCYVCGFADYDCIIDHLLTCDMIGGEGVLIHIPNNIEMDDIKRKLKIMDKKAHTMGVQCKIYLENTIRKSDDHIIRLVELMKYCKTLKLKYGLCIDTCHLQESGFDINQNLDQIIKLKKYNLMFHLNDSNGDGRDYHQHLGHHIWKHDISSLLWILGSNRPIIMERSNIGYMPDLEYLNKINSNNNNNHL